MSLVWNADNQIFFILNKALILFQLKDTDNIFTPIM